MKYLFLMIYLISFSGLSQVISERDRASLKDRILEKRLDSLLPVLMDETEIDMWVLIAREYNEDPVLKTMLPSTWLNARRRTIIVFYRDSAKNTFSKQAIARYDIGNLIDAAWNKEEQPNQWLALTALIKEKKPKIIGVNMSDYFNIADGLVKTDYDLLVKNLPEAYKNKITSAEKLAVRWIETRIPEEMEIYKELVSITHTIIAEAFSTNVIKPGETTTDDVVWWLRQKVTDMGLETWFHPTVDIQRKDAVLLSEKEAFSSRQDKDIIQPGDLIHCDFGITYLGLNTDCQQHAYVLKNHENEVPDYLKTMFTNGNKVQDHLTNNFKTNQTGNEILLKSLNNSKSDGLRPSIYTHPLGVYGHSAGPAIGMWDAQNGVNGTGDYPLYPNTVYAIELNTTVNVPEWNKDIRIMLEEAGFWGEDGFRYVNGRQTELISIPKR
ncbi:M24 family metallopeptidase [Aquimarina intermedia]|uniref:Xaa-Pro aminopeptidase n=1 Tax=Aquimarina intermedia TaxID=350814 RepID=A0A5S5BWR3_9FLAO|nr:M24 family metallopeptidase [Aquimarina intermedia]TYP71444.1 Xaa-Pro aminopeptidase [Aquimarina intermedia]